MKYEKVLEGIFINRPNRFIANVLIDGKVETVHVRNTGRCKEILLEGAKVILEDCSHIPNRKTKYSLIGVWKKDMLINIDSQVPNAVIYKALLDKEIRGFEEISHVKKEVVYGNSRFDIYFESKEEKGFIEIKGATLEIDGISKFPDAPTKRGAKHVLEMIDAVENGYRGVILFLIQMKGPKLFRPNWEMDQEFSDALKLAHEKGVEILAYDSIVTRDSISLGKELEIEILR